MNPVQFQAQRPQQGQLGAMQAPPGQKDPLKGLFTGAVQGFATGNWGPLIGAGVGAVTGSGEAGAAVSGAMGGTQGEDPNKKTKKPPTSDTSQTSQEAVQNQPQGVPDTFQPMGQMLDPMQLLMGLSQQQAPNNMNTMQMQQQPQGFGPQPMMQQPFQTWGVPSPYWAQGG